MNLILTALPRSVLGAIFLQLLFTELRTSWPSNYYAIGDALAAGISRTWRRYSIFRFTPVLVAALVVGATGPGNSADAAVSVGLLALMHIALTTGRSLLTRAVRRALAGRQVLSDLAVTVGVLGASAAGGLLSQPAGRFLPGIDKYVEVLLTGVVAALASAYLNRWTARGAAPDSRAALLSAIPANERNIAIERASHYSVDRDFVLALLATEYVQRPSWIGAMERAASWTRLVRTYGPLQNMPNPNSTPYESIDKAVSSVSGVVLPRRNGWVKNTALMEAHFEQFNRSRIFIEQASFAMMILSNSLAAQSDNPGADGTPHLRCLSVQRVGYTWELEGDISDQATQLTVLAMEPTVADLAVSQESAENRRRKWHSSCSVEVTRVQVISASLSPSSSPPEVLDVLMHARGE